MSTHDRNTKRDGGMGPKRRRNPRACDGCRLKKLRCDGPQEPDQKCWRCITYNDECTFVQKAPKRKPVTRPRGYARRLEMRIAAMEVLFARLRPTSDLSHEMSAMDDDSDDSDMSGSATEDEDPVHLYSHLGGGRTSEADEEDQFAYAVPPVFVPVPALSNEHDHLTHFSTPVPDLNPQSISPYQRHIPAWTGVGGHSSASPEDELESSDEDIDDPLALEGHPSHRDIFTSRRFFGKGSNVAIVKKAAEMKHAYATDIRGFQEPVSPEDRACRDKVHSLVAGLKSSSAKPFDSTRAPPRPTLCLCPCRCMAHPWIHADLQPLVQQLTFPEPDLLYTLVELYFEHFNVFLPALHRPLFSAAVADGLHMRNADFGSILLIVCALGSRYSDDCRVLYRKEDRYDERYGRVAPEAEKPRQTGADGVDPNEWGWHSAGWKWFMQVEICNRMLAQPVTLYDLQIAFLSALYLQGLSLPEVSRRVTGLGLRLAQDLGAHRKRTYVDLSREEGELLKRAFWCLLWLDWTQSPFLGRTCAVQYEDIDLDYPIECDDEYWVMMDPSLSFQQPQGKPTTMAYFNCVLKLNQINAFAYRTLYSTNKSKSLLGFMGSQWEQRHVADLDSALNSWFNSVPAYLRWDPQNPDPVFLRQSACLITSFYTLQIHIHRPFIPHPQQPSHSPIPSLAICTNAARACVRVLDTVHQRMGATDVLNLCTISLFMCGVTLMLSMWGSGSPVTQCTLKDMEEIHKVMYLLKEIERRHHLAGRMWDMLYDLALVGELPLPPHAFPQSVEPEGRVRAAIAVGGSSRRSAAAQPASSRQVKRKDSVSMLYPVMMPPSPEPAHNEQLRWLPLHLIYDSSTPASDNDYDMSPSVFTPQSNATPGPHTDSSDPEAVSVTAAMGSRGISSLPHIYAPKSIPPTIPPASSEFAIIVGEKSQPQPQPQPQPPLNAPDTTPVPFSHSPYDGMAPYIPQLSDDALSMWSHAPAGFEWDDWTAYISGLPERTTSDAVFSPPTHSNDNTSAVFTFQSSPL